MIGVSVKGADRAAANLKTASREVLTAQEVGVRRSTALIERSLKLELSERGGQDAFWGKTGSPGSGLAVRTGRTRASVTGGGASFRVGDRVVGVVGSKEVHLKLHEDGATVPGTSPRGYARIPTGAAQTGAGADRWAGTSIRNIPGAFLLQSKTGRLWAAMRSGNRLTLLYLLVKSVHLRARSIFQRISRKETPNVVAIMKQQISLVVNKANA